MREPRSRAEAESVYGGGEIERAAGLYTEAALRARLGGRRAQAARQARALGAGRKAYKSVNLS